MSTYRIPPAGHADADDLTTPDGLDDAAVARIETVLGQPPWHWLTDAVRAAWERDLSRRSVRLDLSALPDAEAAAMADFLRWPTHRTGTTTISLIKAGQAAARQRARRRARGLPDRIRRPAPRRSGPAPR